MKKICVLIIILLGYIMGCAANSGKPSFNYAQIDSPYHFKQIYMCDAYKGWAISAENEVLFTNSGIEGFISVKNIGDLNSANDFINAAFMDERTAYVAYFSDDNLHLIVEYTDDGGDNWNQTFIKYSDFADVADAGSVYISFADAENGYLLYCSTPALGLMTKLLFYTADAGRTYTFVSDLTNEIAGYPNGIAFSSKGNGYIAVTYHGENSYLYMTEDGAKTWKNINPLLKDEDTGYIDGYAPAFYGKDMQKGILTLKLVGEDVSFDLFTTNDGGHNWIQEGKLPFESVTNYFAMDENCLFYIDEMGNLFELSR